MHSTSIIHPLYIHTSMIQPCGFKVTVPLSSATAQISISAFKQAVLYYMLMLMYCARALNQINSIMDSLALCHCIYLLDMYVIV